jgi:hypothetical protein
MIITKLTGGLGNQMFQYSTGFALAMKNRTELKIDVSGYDDVCVVNSDTPRKFGLSIFNISSPIALSEEIAKTKYPHKNISKAWRFFKQKILKQNYTDYEPKLFQKISQRITKNRKLKEIYKHTPDINFYLDGFFQSEKNFAEFASQIRHEFTFKKEIMAKQLLEIAKEIKNQNSISIHIRRGDYVNNPKTNKYHGTCSLEYYERALNLIKERLPSQSLTFYIFTDDPVWANENFAPLFPKEKFTNISDFHFRPFEEMYLMSKCQHNIIANSSFSWWGAWLNKNSDKIVIAPREWTQCKKDPHPNIIPTTWIKI